MPRKELLKKSAAASLLGWTKQRFHYYFKQDRIPGKEIIGCVPFFDKDKLMAWSPEDRREYNGHWDDRKKHK